MLPEKKQPALTRTKWGFYQYDPLPSEEELNTYYEQKYYQQGCGSYEVSYSDEETSYFKLKASLVYRKAMQLSGDVPGKRMIDIGCGEGWIMEAFRAGGYSVVGLDFSRYGIEKCHPHLVPYLEQGNLYRSLHSKTAEAAAYDYIVCANVIEHVIDPVALLRELRKIMHDKSVLIIIAPNDFSLLHYKLLDEKRITKQFWLAYPDHLSYFNKESMSKFLDDQGFTIRTILADNPIDLNLMNDNSNYVEDPSKGKTTHLFRLRTDNFLGQIDAGKLMQIYEILGSMGIGRNLYYYCAIGK